MSDRIAYVISFLFHPILMPTYALLIFFNLRSYVNYALEPEHLWMILSLCFINTAAMPALFLFVLYRMNRISDLHLRNQYQRTLPFLVGCLFFFFNYYLFRSSGLPQIVISMALAGALVVFLSFLFNFWIKISIHAVGIASIAGVFMGVSQILNTNINMTIMSLLLITGLVGTARLKLKAHDPMQVYMGSLLGLIIGFGAIYLKLG